jgi:hypothetical protein
MPIDRKTDRKHTQKTAFGLTLFFAYVTLRPVWKSPRFVEESACKPSDPAKRIIWQGSPTGASLSTKKRRKIRILVPAGWRDLFCGG